MSERQSQRSITSSVQHRQEAEVAAVEERERAVAETAAMAARAELAAARAEIEAATAVDAAHAVAAELESLRASSTSSSVFADDDRDNELRLARETVREQAAQWAAAHPRGAMAATLMGADTSAALQAGARAANVPPTVAVAQTGVDASAAGLTEIAAFTGGTALPPRKGTMVTMGSRSLLGTSVPATGGLPSPRPITSSGSR
jgi:hypothetical protein